MRALTTDELVVVSAGNGFLRWVYQSLAWEAVMACAGNAGQYWLDAQNDYATRKAEQLKRD